MISFHGDREHKRGRYCLSEVGDEQEVEVLQVGICYWEQHRPTCPNSGEWRCFLPTAKEWGAGAGLLEGTLGRGIRLGGPHLLSGWGVEGEASDILIGAL